MTTYPSVKAQVNGKPYLAVAVGNITYLIWTVARDTGANLTKTAYGDVEIGGSKPPQVTQSGNTFIKWSSIPTLSLSPTRDSNGVWQFATSNVGFTDVSGSQPGGPILDLTAQNIKSLVIVKTNIGGWFFDAILNTNHTSSLTITSHPVQTGSNVSDYAYMQPRQISMNIGMSDVATSIVPGQFSGGSSRSVEAWKVLQQLQALRIPIQVYTRLGLYQNMLIQSLTTQDDNSTQFGLRATVQLQELLVATVETVKVSANPAVTSSSSKGQKQPQQPTPQMTSELQQLITGISNLLNGKSGG